MSTRLRQSTGPGGVGLKLGLWEGSQERIKSIFRGPGGGGGEK